MDERSQRGDETPHADGSLSEFLKELQRRRVIRVGLVYVVVAWAIIQVAETTFTPLGLPDWTVTFVVLLCMLGFPVAIILSWAYRIEAENGDPTATTVEYVVPRKRGLDFLIIGALSIAVLILGYELYVRHDSARVVVDEEGTADVRMQEPAAEITAAPGQELPEANTKRPSIGVLPFLNLSDDKANEYFADGLAEEILNLLVRVRELDVTARTSSFFYKGKDMDIRAIARQLGVSTVLEGSVRRQGDRIRVTAQLIEAETGYHLWSETYDRELEDVFAIQDDISREVVEAVGAVISGESQRALERIPTDNFEAYEAYLQGRALLRIEHTPENLDAAKGLFRKAIRLDPDFAGAHAGLCSSLLGAYRKSRSTEYFEAAEKSCIRGLTLDANSGDVHTSLGQLYRFSGQYDKAIDQFQRALTLNNRNMGAHFGLAGSYKQQGAVDKAEAVYKEAIIIQPGYYRTHIAIGNFFYYEGRYSEAIRAYQEALALAPEDSSVYQNMGAAFYFEGMFDQAASSWRQSLRMQPTVDGYMNVGTSYFFLGRYDDAIEMYEKAIDIAPEDFEVWGSLGDALRLSGGREVEAFDAYSKAIELAEKIYAINQSDALHLGPLSGIYAHVGRDAEARQMIESALELEPSNVYVRYFAAVTYASLDDLTAGRAALDEALRMGYPENFVRSDPGLAKLLTDETP
ncbi:MAG: tetratricopeptide repeat protein [Pseudomonadota bacterium]